MESYYFWPRGPVHHEDGWIVSDSPKMREGDPGPEKLIAFAGVRDLADALRFAERYGLLDEHPRGGPYRESFADWQEEAGRLAGLLSQYIDLPRSGEGKAAGEQSYQDARRLAVAIDEGRKGVVSVFGIGHRKTYDKGAADSQVWSTWFSDAAMDGPLRSVLYYELGEIAKRGDELRRCEDCGRAFIPANRRQRFCNTTCAARTRYHRKAQRARESAAAVDAAAERA